MKTPLRRALLGLLAALTMTAATACTGSDSAPGTLTVGFVVDPSWAQIPVASATGLFDREGLRVKVVNFSSGVEALQALAAGQVDITTAADVPSSAALARNPSLRVVGDGSRWQGSRIVARRDAGISTLSDLAGKSVGTPLGTSAAYYATNALAAGHVDARLVQAAPSATLTAITQRNVDAVSIFQPYQAQVVAALGDNAVELTGGTYNQHSLYLSSQSAITGKRAEIGRFFTALRAAGGELDRRSDPAVAAVAAATQLDPALLRTILAEFDFTLQLTPDAATKLRELGTWAQTQGNLDRAVALPDYATLLETGFVGS
ncbi:ABC transporter substrate-binding protein [Nocardia thailandica]